jgi:Tol biopolymer transport system component
MLLAGVTWAQVTERVSVNSSGEQGNSLSERPEGTGRTISANGRYAAFLSHSSNLVPGDTNDTYDVFLRDRLEGETELISVATTGSQGNGISGLFGITLTPDGRYVAFESRATSLVPGDTNAARDIFLRDRLNGTTERVSVATGGAQGNADSLLPSISSDGRYVAFASEAANLVQGDTNGTSDIFVRDRVTGSTERVSLGTGGTQGDNLSNNPSMSANGRWIAFESLATNLVPGDTNGRADIFVRDRQVGSTERVSVSTAGIQGDDASSNAVISSNGRFVVFSGSATNLVPSDVNMDRDVFLRDRRSATTELVSLATGGAQGDGPSSDGWISDDGRWVAFTSSARNLIPGGSNPGFNVFVRDRLGGPTEIVSVTNAGFEPQSPRSQIDAMSQNGRYVVFRSYNRELVPGDSNGLGDVFLHDRSAAGFISLCDPGANSVAVCPCSNPPSGAGRGCDNSAATGGAELSATGIAYLSIDSLVFTMSGGTATSASILLQATAPAVHGFSFGQGVRCVAGTIKRLYTKTASGGSITAPDLGAGDPTVSARSAALGDIIQAGQSRWYLVYYRDPIVLGGCDSWRAFNATQTGQVTWWP